MTDLTDDSIISTAHTSPICKRKLDKDSLSTAIAYILHEIIKENEVIAIVNNKENKTKEEKDNIDIFKGMKIPSISIENFLKRIIKYTNLENSTLILSLIYIDRYCEITKKKLNKQNIHRLLFLGVVLAIKFNEDDYYGNAFYAKVGGIVLEELNFLELGFIKGIEYTLFVSEGVYDKYESYLCKFNEL